MTNKPISLAKKILAVSQSIGCVEKNGLNQHFKFRYQAWDDVLPAVRNACVEVGVQITPTITSVKHDGTHVLVEMKFIVKDSETQESDEFQWYGESKGNDDKLIQKAITSCTKYALLKFFMIPIIDDTDTDADAPEPIAKTQKSQPKTAKEEPKKVDAEVARSVFVKQVYAEWTEIGGTITQFEQLKVKLASVNFPIKATDMIHEALREGCTTVPDVHHWITSKHPELPHPFKLEDV